MGGPDKMQEGTVPLTCDMLLLRSALRPLQRAFGAWRLQRRALARRNQRNRSRTDEAVWTTIENWHGRLLLLL